MQLAPPVYSLTMCALITLAFAILLALLLTTFLRNKERLERIAYIDIVTGGNTMAKFTETTEKSLAGNAGVQYALVYLNIEKFKVLNEQFGKKACDQMLKLMDNTIAKDLEADECIGRLFADNFCILVRYIDENTIVERFSKWRTDCIALMKEASALWTSPTVDFGVYVITNRQTALEYMIGRAKLSLTELSKELHSNFRYAIYDENVRKALFREKHLEDIMESALASEEFVVFLQPKYSTKTEKISGAEALVRWKSETEGMIYPDEFIPLFEKNGFIVRIDMYVFEEVCKTIRGWIDAGKNPIKISVNCSRIHFTSLKFLASYSEIADRYNIPKKYIEIELTESIVFSNVETLTNIINRIHKVGFGCSMDDFGSGYSSLNLIQDIPVDTLKLDKIFFHGNMRDIGRTASVVGSIITMSKALSMETVAEGIEEREHVDMLKHLGCDYIQGYYFAKPMPIDEFEKLAF